MFDRLKSLSLSDECHSATSQFLTKGKVNYMLQYKLECYSFKFSGFKKCVFLSPMPLVQFLFFCSQLF